MPTWFTSTKQTSNVTVAGVDLDVQDHPAYVIRSESDVPAEVLASD